MLNAIVRRSLLTSRGWNIWRSLIRKPENRYHGMDRDLVRNQNSTGSEKTCSHHLRVYSFCSWEWKIYHIVDYSCTVSFFFSQVDLCDLSADWGQLAKLSWAAILSWREPWPKRHERIYSNWANICQPGSNIYIIHSYTDTHIFKYYFTTSSSLLHLRIL